VYETLPVGYQQQPNFLNAVVEVDSALCPEALLEVLLGIETSQGRQRLERWGPRTLDLDLLDQVGCYRNLRNLVLPHPAACQRLFVLKPWADLASEHRLGPLTVAQWLERLPQAGCKWQGSLELAHCQSEVLLSGSW
jgi:2-amino-4-hydroxy-6-hydroxymethyldihydropteridine diphosphokinase